MSHKSGCALSMEIDLVIDGVYRILKTFTVLGEDCVHFDNEFVLQGQAAQEDTFTVVVIDIDGGAVEGCRNDGMGGGVDKGGISDLVTGEMHHGFGVKSGQSGNDIERDVIAVNL